MEDVLALAVPDALLAAAEAVAAAQILAVQLVIMNVVQAVKATANHHVILHVAQLAGEDVKIPRLAIVRSCNYINFI